MYFLFDLLFLLLVGILIGHERQKTHGIIGVRSVTLVLLGSFIFTYISTIVGGDPARIIAQVVTGTGFIGAGLIFKQEASCINNIAKDIELLQVNDFTFNNHLNVNNLTKDSEIENYYYNILIRLDYYH